MVPPRLARTPRQLDCALVETWEAIRTLRAVRGFAERPLETEHLRRILHAGRRAPSSMNRQRRGFIVVRDRGRLRDLAAMGTFAGHLAGAAAGIALVTPRPEDPDRVPSLMLDLGQAAQNMMLAAWDLGIGSAHASVHDQRRARELLGFPEDHECRYLLSFGYPADPSDLVRPPAAGGRRPLSEVVHWERW